METMNLDTYRALQRPQKPAKASATGKPKRSPRHLEAMEQAKVIAWARARALDMPKSYPHLGRIFCSLAGMPMTEAQAKRAKGQGNRSGVFDLILPVPRGGYHGCLIEMKSRDGRPSKEQLDELEFLASVGYFARICRGHIEAIDAIREYYKTQEGANGP